VPVLPDGTVVDVQAAANRGYSGLHGWMAAADALWNANAESGTMTLVERWNYHNELGAQFPLPPLRVVYTKAGTLPAACVIRAPFVIDHMLYWASPSSEAEAFYLIAIFNSETARARVAALQARGQWGARHFDKVLFTLPIPRCDGAVSLHTDLADAAREAEVTAATVTLPKNVRFQRARKLVRDPLMEAGVAPRIEALVARLLSAGSWKPRGPI
jgi:hypothetical protein